MQDLEPWNVTLRTQKFNTIVHATNPGKYFFFIFFFELESLHENQDSREKLFFRSEIV